jgi:tRNA threonylcarbamoyladenosine biosynthesis protein TsaE
MTINFRNLDLSGIDQLACALVSRLPHHVVFGLVGTLGAGKTSLTQSIARAASIDPAEVTSPTFTLLQTHQGKFTLHHLDAYRVADDDEFLELGVAELFEQPAWTIVEWADRVENVMPADTVWLHIEIETDDTRSLTASCHSQELSRLLAEIQGDLDAAT